MDLFKIRYHLEIADRGSDVVMENDTNCVAKLTLRTETVCVRVRLFTMCARACAFVHNVCMRVCVCLLVLRLLLPNSSYHNNVTGCNNHYLTLSLPLFNFVYNSTRGHTADESIMSCCRQQQQQQQQNAIFLKFGNYCQL